MQIDHRDKSIVENSNQKLKNQYKEIDQEEFDPSLSRKELDWVNKFLNVMIKEWFINDFFYYFIRTEL